MLHLPRRRILSLTGTKIRAINPSTPPATDYGVNTRARHTRPDAPDVRALVMTNDSSIIDLYDWETGACFRCARTNLPTTHLHALQVENGDIYQIRACETCILQLEADRRRAAERCGQSYRPGRLMCRAADDTPRTGCPRGRKSGE